MEVSVFIYSAVASACGTLFVAPLIVMALKKFIRSTDLD